MNKGILLVLFTALVSGFSIFLNSYAVKGLDSSVFTFSKNIVVAVLLFAAILGFGKLNELRMLSKKQWLQLVAIGFVGGSIPFLLFFRGLQLTTGTTGSFVYRTLFIWVALLAVIFLKEKLSKGLLIGAGLLLAGNFVILQPKMTYSTGILLIAAATLFWAVENIWSKHLLKEVSGTVVALGRMFFGSIFIFAFLAFTGKAGTVFSMSWQQYSWILVTAAFLFLYVLSYYNGLATIDASVAASILVLGSPITTLLDFSLRGTAVSVGTAIGSLLIIGGVVSVLWFGWFASKVKQLFGVADGRA